jgi:uncharacterized protein (TIGR02246 family)
MRRPLAAFALFLIVSVCAVGQTAGGEANPISNAKDEEGVRKVLADFVEAWNKHDAKAFSMVFAEDADFTNVAGVSAHGRTEVEKFHAPRFETTFKDTHQKITETKIRFIKPDVAAVDARWEMVGAKSREGQDIPLRKGLLSFVMTKRGEKWLITVMHNMNLPDSP